MEYRLKVIDSDLISFDASLKVIDGPDGVTIVFNIVDGFEVVEKDTFPFVCVK
tara:strand:+ start:113 stop:271 length:159 start_codon:yes stop_codon:yes gene_type:complete